MITADTNVILDLLIPGAPDGDDAERALELAASQGPLTISEVVYAELAPQFMDEAALDGFLDDVGIQVQRSSTRALFVAGQAWRSYLRQRSAGLLCQSCGARNDMTCATCREPLRARQHLLADFLIGAHAAVHAGAMLTRDRGYYRTYFPELTLIGQP